MPNCPRIGIDLVIITSGERLVPEEMNSLVFNARDIFFGFNMAQAVGLVPAGWENVERDLATN